MKRLALLLLLLVPAYFPSVVVSPQAQDKKTIGPVASGITFPATISKTTIINPGKLTSELVYVVEGKVPFVVLASPPGLVKVTPDTGPIKIRARFFDGYGVETRTFNGPQLYLIEAAGVGKVELLAIPNTFKGEADIIRRTVDVDNGQAPQPPPGPTPPTPNPDNPAPIPDTGFRVMILEDKLQLSTLPEDQLAIRTSAEVRAYLNSHCVAEASGVKAFRIWDVNTVADADLKVWQDTLNKYKQRRPLPWLIVSDGKTGFEGPLPKTITETMTLLKKYGGN